MIFDPSRQFLYVGIGDPGRNWTTEVAIQVVDTASDTIIATIPLNGEPGTNLEMSRDGSALYVVSRNQGSERLYKISTVTYAVTGTLDVIGVGDTGLSISPDGQRLYVAHESANLIHVIDTSAMKEVGSIRIPKPTNFSVSPDGLHAIAVDQQDQQLYWFTLAPSEESKN
jgi:YVTN family beta-propeller protein